jgi:hypothetical protein
MVVVNRRGSGYLIVEGARHLCRKIRRQLVGTGSKKWFLEMRRGGMI